MEMYAQQRGKYLCLKVITPIPARCQLLNNLLLGTFLLKSKIHNNYYHTIIHADHVGLQIEILSLFQFGVFTIHQY